MISIFPLSGELQFPFRFTVHRLYGGSTVCGDIKGKRKRYRDGVWKIQPGKNVGRFLVFQNNWYLDRPTNVLVKGISTGILAG